MYAVAARAQFLPEPGTPGAWGLGNFETLGSHNQHLLKFSFTGEVDSLNQYEHGIEVKKCL